MLILCLSPESSHWKLIPGYAAAFRRLGIQFHCVEDTLPLDISIDEVLKLCPEPPAYVFHFESAFPLLPSGIEACPVPTVCFHPDTYAFTARRIRWSFLFDHAVVFHPGYVEQFAAAGHRGAFLLPHAVRSEFFDLPECSREFDIGWVGQTGGENYQARAAWLPQLAAKFRMNEISRKYSIEEVANLYRRSKIIVNIGRDDFPQDANLRVFEALASGALLLTKLPTELEPLGFKVGEHFAGYQDEREVIPMVERYLQDEAARSRISHSARIKTLSEHTYDVRARQILQRLEAAGSSLSAPARSWPRSRARLMAVDFFASHNVWGSAARQYLSVVGGDLASTAEGARLLARAAAKKALQPWAKFARRSGNTYAGVRSK